MKVFLLILAGLVVAVLFIAFLLPTSQKSTDNKIMSMESAALLAPSAVPAHVNRSPASATAQSASGQKVLGETAPQDLGTSEDAKAATLETINEAMTTYSAEGLPVLRPYLKNPDPEIRAAALEAIVQLGVPEGAQVLREAANSAKTTREQIEMLQGAEFLELPRLPVGELKKLIQSGAIRIPQQLPAE